MTQELSGHDLALLVQRVFSPGPRDRALAILVDLPNVRLPDNADWRRRRQLATGWAQALAAEKRAAGLQQITLAWFRNSGSNNAELPPDCTPLDPGKVRLEVLNSTDELADLPEQSFASLFDSHSIILAPTELSATAPLKVAARDHAFRAATMPGFSPSMIPALKLDYVEINRRCSILKELCDRAETAQLVLVTSAGRHELQLDLRYRNAHASGGLFPANGVAGNLPSGETYIVPYEGERPGEASRSAGQLPVQLDDEVVLYEIAENRAIAVLSSGPRSEAEARYLQEEPAYANLAELGLGVLGDFGLKPAGSILLDEKLGLHIAFGRSDHFGGSVGPADFSRPEAVIHLDRVYIHETQPRVHVQEVRLCGPGLDRLVMQDGIYTDIFA